MFGCAPAKSKKYSRYGRVIHFADTFTEVEWDIRTWLDKFEVLLRCLYWRKVVVHMEAFYLPDQTFVWQAKKEWLSRLTESLQLPKEWDFESSMEIKDLSQLRGV